ncbi:GNAT family N-acetyltransferase [Cohnella herbarum]|uniref:GNAT family N-acetyltransferase n=1 Tax=Cohnella herbarum TaxID=2728023 RepID=UPI0035C00266
MLTTSTCCGDDEILPFTRVAVVEGRVVGFGSARPVDDFLELEDLFTDPDWMRQGAANAPRCYECSTLKSLEIELRYCPSRKIWCMVSFNMEARNGV